MTTIWVDAQISPRIARWIAEKFRVAAHAVRDLGLRDASDLQIFAEARRADAIVLTKDADFVHLLEQRGSPPKILWLICGNTSNEVLQHILALHLMAALHLLERGEEAVRIGDP